MPRLQFTTHELIGTTVIAAIAAWLISLELGFLVPALVAMAFAMAYRKQSSFPLPLIMFGGASIGLAVTISAALSVEVYIARNFALGPLHFIGHLGIAIAWLVTLMIFLQFRKLIRRDPAKQ